MLAFYVGPRRVREGTLHSARLRYADTPRDASQESTAACAVHRPEAVSRDSRHAVLDPGERALLKSVERGEWTAVARFRAEKARHARFAKATLRRLRKA